MTVAIAAVSTGIRDIVTRGLGAAATAVLVRLEDFRDGAPTFAVPAVSVLLYRADTSPAVRNTPLPRGPQRLAMTLPLDLHYLVTPYGTSAEEEHQLLGAAMQALADMPVLPLEGGGQAQVTLDGIPDGLLTQLFAALGLPLRPTIALLARTTD